MKALLFETISKLYRSIEQRWIVHWHPDYHRAFVRIMVSIKQRFFSGHGKSDLWRWLETPMQPVSGAIADPLVQSLVKHASSPPSHEAWLWQERENLLPVTRHLGLGNFDWNQALTTYPKNYSYRRPAVARLINELRLKNISHVLIVPWLQRHGGADKAAICYLDVLARRFPGRVLLIATELGVSPWLKDRIPPDVEIIEWVELDRWPDITTSVKELAALLYVVQPRVLHVMNSWLGWELLRREGLRLRSLISTWASLFWYGPSEPNCVRGYASEYLPRVASSLDGVIIDNAKFPWRLQQDYGFPSDLFHCVYHPTMHFAEKPKSRNFQKDCLRVLWASRFAIEKRMDLLLAIAMARPQHQFFVYGGTDGDDHGLIAILNELQALPNVILRGIYDGFESLPLNECDIFLYTSSSDGMPNTVIEAMAHGIPLIAPDVGGVSELVDGTTGWLVTNINETGEYLSAIDELATDPEKGLLRATAALARVRERHSFHAFESMLDAVPGYLD